MRILGVFALGIALLIGTTTVRLVIEGKQHLDEGRIQKGQGDLFRATTAFEDAAKAYVPFSPYHLRGLRELEIMAKGATMRGENERALAIWEITRRSVLASRHFWQPNEHILVRAEQAITNLRSLESHGKTTTMSPIARPKDPSPLGSILLFLGFLLWTGGAATLCLGYHHTRSWRSNWVWAATALGLSTWLIMAWLTP